MRKIIFITALSLLIFITGVILFLTTAGYKTNRFNSLINQKIIEVNPNFNLKLNDVNFKLNATNFKFEIITYDPKILNNDKKIDLETISFDLNILNYFNNKNPISQILVKSKENNINQLNDFINEYNFNLKRKLILKQIKNGKIEFTTKINFDENEPNKFTYLLNGSVREGEVKLPNQLKAENIKFDFKIDNKLINLKKIELVFDKIFISSDEIQIKKINKEYEVGGNLKTKKTEIRINNYIKIINKNVGILSDETINLSSDSNLFFKINSKFKIDNLKINSKLSFDQLLTKSKIQDLIYLKDGNVIINYDNKKLNVAIDSKFLFKNDSYNNADSNTLFKLIYQKKQNMNASVDINLINTRNKIKSKEIEKFLSFKNFNLPNQEIIFASENMIKFNLNKNNKIQNLNVKSQIKTDNILINYESKRVKKYLSNFKNQLKLSKSDLNINYSNNNFKTDLKSNYSINDINEKITLNLEKKNKNYIFDLNIDLDSAEIQLDELDYKKNENIKSNLYVKGKYKENNEINFDIIQFNDEKKGLLIQNLEISKNDKIKNLDLLKIDLVNKYKKTNELEFKKVNDNYYLTGSEFDGTKNIKNILDSSSNSIFSNFKNLNTYIYLDIGKYAINKEDNLAAVRGEIQIKKNQIYKANIIAKLNKNKKFKLNIFTNSNKQKITNLEIEQPEPFIKNYKFIKGFKEGRLIYEATENEGKTKSKLKIIDFKVQEVPVLAKLLTLASLQGIADLLTGEGIRFTDFEMDYETLGNTTNIKEIYAIGPAISLMMQGYIVKNQLTSLRGTLVPATTVNKTISKIPMLGDILVGKKIGEGVFGVSFKIKGPPKNLKTTVNPIKTLTPRFITRTLEKIAN